MMILGFVPRDTGWMPWAVVAVCLLASALAFGLQARSRGRQRAFWIVVMLVMLALGVNKQLDLQTELTRYVRGVARDGGWYAERRAVQAGFLVALTAGVALSTLVLGWLARRAARGVQLALLGMVLMAGFVLLRAASFHHFDAALQVVVAGGKLHSLVELGGALLVLAGAWVALNASRRREAPR